MCLFSKASAYVVLVFCCATAIDVDCGHFSPRSHGDSKKRKRVVSKERLPLEEHSFSEVLAASDVRWKYCNLLELHGSRPNFHTCPSWKEGFLRTEERGRAVTQTSHSRLQHPSGTVQQEKIVSLQKSTVRVFRAIKPRQCGLFLSSAHLAAPPLDEKKTYSADSLRLQ